MPQLKRQIRRKLDTAQQKRRKTLNLPTDILSDIFSRIPVKTLLRCKSVCKTWLTLIKDPILIKFYQNRYKLFHPNHTGIATLHNFDGSSYMHFSSMNNKNHAVTKIMKEFNNVLCLASCNGLLCFLSKDRKIRICNPTTEEIRVLPRPKCLRRRREVGETIMFLGMGYDPVVETYKILCWNAYDPSEAEIMTVGENSWRIIIGPSSEYTFHHWLYAHFTVSEYMNAHLLYAHFTSSVYMNGASHWYQNSENKLISFVFSIEKFRYIALPDIDRYDRISRMCEFRGRLCLVECIRSNAVIVKMWILRNYEEGVWELLQLVLPRTGIMSAVPIADDKFIIRPIWQSDEGYLCCFDEDGHIVINKKVPDHLHSLLYGQNFRLGSLLSLKNVANST